MAHKDTNQTTKSKTYRLVTGVFGLSFMAISIAILLISELSFESVVAALVIAVLGLDAGVGAYRNTPCLLSRLGPLP